MEKINDFFKSKYIFMGIFLYFLADFFLKGPIENAGFFWYTYLYIGKFSILICFLIAVNLILSLVKSNDKRKLFPISIEFITIGSLCVVYLYFMIELKIPFENKAADQTLLRNSINIALFEKEIGYIPTYLFYLLLSKFNYLVVYIGLSGLILLSVAIAFIYPAIKGIIAFYREYAEKERVNSEIIAKRKELERDELEIKKFKKEELRREELRREELRREELKKEELKREELKKEELKREEIKREELKRKKIEVETSEKENKDKNKDKNSEKKIEGSELKKNQNALINPDKLVNSFDFFLGKDKKSGSEITKSGNQVNIIKIDDKNKSKINNENKNKINNKNNIKNSDLTNSIEKQIREELKEELIKEIKNEIKNEVKNEIAREINTENIKEGIKEDIKENIKENLKEVIKENIKEDIKDNTKEKIELKKSSNNNIEKNKDEKSKVEIQIDEKQGKKVIKLSNLVDIYAMLEKEQEQKKDKDKKDTKVGNIIKLYKK
jgi:hypothetical protein